MPSAFPVPEGKAGSDASEFDGGSTVVDDTAGRVFAAAPPFDSGDFSPVATRQASTVVSALAAREQALQAAHAMTVPRPVSWPLNAPAGPALANLFSDQPTAVAMPIPGAEVPSPVEPPLTFPVASPVLPMPHSRMLPSPLPRPVVQAPPPGKTRQRWNALLGGGALAIAVTLTGLWLLGFEPLGLGSSPPLTVHVVAPAPPPVLIVPLPAPLPPVADSPTPAAAPDLVPTPVPPQVDRPPGRRSHSRSRSR